MLKNISLIGCKWTSISIYEGAKSNRYKRFEDAKTIGYWWVTAEKYTWEKQKL